ncbi:hypothetical protein H6F51_20145 [Cyanobacteria bacterium FACHB-DQ100]|nr:hypothetical protein [Cyanobacteria bacterium FACHB-DQ100]
MKRCQYTCAIAAYNSEDESRPSINSPLEMPTQSAIAHLSNQAFLLLKPYRMQRHTKKALS